MHKRAPGRSPTGRRLRFDKGQRQLIRRDADVLRLIGEQYTYRFDQLQGVLARHPDSQSADPEVLSETRTRAAIQKWEQLGLARSRKIFHEQPAYVWLTPRGLRRTGLDVEPCVYGRSFLPVWSIIQQQKRAVFLPSQWRTFFTPSRCSGVKVEAERP